VRCRSKTTLIRGEREREIDRERERKKEEEEGGRRGGFREAKVHFSFAKLSTN